MSGLPNEIPELGNTTQQPRPNPAFDPSAEGSFTSEDYFVWSRIDGAVSLSELILMTGFETHRAISILTKLHKCGAFLLPHEKSRQIQRSVNKAAQGTQEQPPAASSNPQASPAKGATGDGALEIAELTDAERALFESETIFDDSQKLRILAMARVAVARDYYTLLGVDREADKRGLKRAYFAVSKEFHPDRYYGKDVGGFAPLLAKVFEASSKAFDILRDDKKRAAYDGDGGALALSQTPKEHALSLFDNACGYEMAGELESAIKYFGAAIRVDAQPRYLKRAAQCAIKAKELNQAEEYAKKAAALEPEDPSYARVVSDVYVASGRYEEAEKVLQSALELKTENDVLAGELRRDLDRVRERVNSRKEADQ